MQHQLSPFPLKPKNLPLHKMIPNMITLTALAVGMTSIKYAIMGKWEAAALAIVVAGFMDAFDGAAARLLKAQSKLGAELDSFSDFLCFGVAPALVVYLWTLQSAGRWGWTASLIFAIATALRLSRFNIVSDDADRDNPLSKYFTGVPSPVGAGLCLLPLFISLQDDSMDMSSYMSQPMLVGIWTVIVAAMLVSNIPTFSTKQIRIPYRMKMPALAVFGLLVAALINAPWPTLTILCVIYLFMMPFGVRHYCRKEKKLAESGQTADDNDGDGDDNDA